MPAVRALAGTQLLTFYVIPLSCAADASVLAFLSPIFVAALRQALLDGSRPTGRGLPAGHALAPCPLPPGLPQGYSGLLQLPGSQAAASTALAPPPPALAPPRLLCSPFILRERSSRGVLLGIPVAMVGVVLVAQPSFIPWFGGGGGIRWAARVAGGAGTPGCGSLGLCAHYQSTICALAFVGHLLGPKPGAGCLPAATCPSPAAVPTGSACWLRCPSCSALGVTVGVFQALFNSLARMSVRALR